MRLRSHRLATAVFAGLLGASGVVAFAEQPATQPSSQDLQAQVDQLKAQLAQVQSTQQQDHDQNAKAVQAIISDADSHTKMFDAPVGGLNGGWNADKKQFFLASDDGHFYLHPGLIFQGRYSVDYRRTPNTTADGFEVRRMKFNFDGYAFSPDLTYKFQWQDGQSGGTPTLEWGFAQYVFLHNVGSFGGDIGLKAGQFKDYAVKEEAIVADTNQPLVERSMVNSTVGGNALGGTLLEGVDLVYTEINIRCMPI
jgi:hypothetical protein